MLSMVSNSTVSPFTLEADKTPRQVFRLAAEPDHDPPRALWPGRNLTGSPPRYCRLTCRVFDLHRHALRYKAGAGVADTELSHRPTPPKTTCLRRKEGSPLD